MMYNNYSFPNNPIDTTPYKQVNKPSIYWNVKALKPSNLLLCETLITPRTFAVCVAQPPHPPPTPPHETRHTDPSVPRCTHAVQHCQQPLEGGRGNMRPHCTPHKGTHVQYINYDPVLRYHLSVKRNLLPYINLSDTSNYPGHSFGQFSLF